MWTNMFHGMIGNVPSAIISASVKRRELTICLAAGPYFIWHFVVCNVSSVVELVFTVAAVAVVDFAFHHGLKVEKVLWGFQVPDFHNIIFSGDFKHQTSTKSLFFWGFQVPEFIIEFIKL